MAYMIRVYSASPHAHLLEEGHDQVMNPKNPERGYSYLGEAAETRGIAMGRRVKEGRGIGRKIGRVRAYGVLDNASRKFAPQFASRAEQAIDTIISKI